MSPSSPRPAVALDFARITVTDPRTRVLAALKRIQRSSGRCLDCLGLSDIPIEEIVAVCRESVQELPRCRLVLHRCDRCRKKVRCLRWLR